MKKYLFLFAILVIFIGCNQNQDEDDDVKEQAPVQVKHEDSYEVHVNHRTLPDGRAVFIDTIKSYTGSTLDFEYIRYDTLRSIGKETVKNDADQDTVVDKGRHIYLSSRGEQK